MQLKDTASGYGWVSILLHWITAILIVYLLYLGSTIGSFEDTGREQAVNRHTSFAITGYVLLLWRVVWRIVYRHPGPTEAQRGWAFTAGKWTHYAIVAAIAVMMVTGPLTQFSYGRDIHVFDWFVIPAPFGPVYGLASFLHAIHAFTAGFILVTVILHIGGVYKHTAFNQDGTLAKIIIPGRQSDKTRVERSPIAEQGES